MNWRDAHRTAMIRATQAHHELGVDPSGYVDVYQALHRAKVMLMAQPMPGLFGIYLPATAISNAGVMVNSERDDIAQRHSAAHEIGHHLFGHALCLDEGINAFDTANPGSWPAAEKQAEAFAAWFLMPGRAVRGVLRVLGLTQLTRPEEVYQVALHLGTSYRGTLRHLVNLKLLSAGQAAEWTKARPAVLRARAQASLCDAPPGRVWALGPSADGAMLRVRPGDRLAITTGGHGQPCELPAGVVAVTPAPSARPNPPMTEPEGRLAQVLLEITTAFTCESRLCCTRTAASHGTTSPSSASPPWAIRLAVAPALGRGFHPPP